MAENLTNQSKKQKIFSEEQKCRPGTAILEHSTHEAYDYEKSYVG